MVKKKLKPGEIPGNVMEGILKTLQQTSFGEVVLVAQDGVLVQVEWNEKLRLDCWDEHWNKEPWEKRTLDCVAEHVRSEFSHLQFGKLVIVVKRGHIIQMERTEKQRFTGLDGEGI